MSATSACRYSGKPAERENRTGFRDGLELQWHAGLGIECEGDQGVVVEVDHAVQVEVAAGPAGEVVVEAGVDSRVVIEVDDAVEVGVAVPGVADEHVVVR